jgi:hypothetical protein
MSFQTLVSKVTQSLSSEVVTNYLTSKKASQTKLAKLCLDPNPIIAAAATMVRAVAEAKLHPREYTDKATGKTMKWANGGYDVLNAIKRLSPTWSKPLDPESSALEGMVIPKWATKKYHVIQLLLAEAELVHSWQVYGRPLPDLERAEPAEIQCQTTVHQRDRT